MKLFEIRNQPAPWMLCESAEQATHLEHLEDLIFNQGYEGAKMALNYIESLRQMLAEGTGHASRVTVKWDGAPAIHCGIDPADGKFFVGTKSVFAKTEPKLCKSRADINKFYSEQPGLAEKLAICLKYLPKLGISGVVKGDLMFTQADLKVENINGEECVTFTPNTITYAVPVQDELAKRIQRAKLGIVFHTSYEGTEVSNMSAQFGYSVAGLTPSNDVWFDDAYYSDYTGVASLTPEENAGLQRGLGQSAKTLKKITPDKFNIILNNAEFAKYIKPFINNMVRGGEQVGEPIAFLNQFVTFYKGKMEAEIAKLKGGPDSKAAQDRIRKIQEKEQFIADNSNALLGILAMYKKVVELKLIIIQKLQKIESIGTFIKSDNGYKVSKPEGFVAIGHDGGAVKLVDRIVFSKENFQSTKQWKQG
jgi:hypothetical protein